MALITVDNQALPAIPAAGKTVLFAESGAKRLTYREDSGKTYTLAGGIQNQNTADVVASGADTYLTGSGLVVPVGLSMQVGTTFKWTLGLTKSAAGTAAPTWVVRVGTTGTTADTGRLTFTQGASQTAAVDIAEVSITAVLRNVGAAGILAGITRVSHVLPNTGFSTVEHFVSAQVSAGFDTTVANLIIGVSVNPGAAGVWTHQVVLAEMGNI